MVTSAVPELSSDGKGAPIAVAIILFFVAYGIAMRLLHITNPVGLFVVGSLCALCAPLVIEARKAIAIGGAIILILYFLGTQHH